MNDSTKSVDERIDEKTGAVTTPIYQTVAFEFPEGEKYRYSREANPTVCELSRKIAQIEEAEMGVSFSSGMGAISTTMFHYVSPGKTIVIHKDMFGRSFRFFNDFLKGWGVNVKVSNIGTASLLDEINSLPRVDVVFIESITNPLLRVLDVEEISKVTKEKGGSLIVDNTFASPINMKPIKLNADIVIESGSKFISGHNDVIAGLAAGPRDVMVKIDLMRRTMGTSMDPHTAYLTIRGMKTLKIRMDVINRNALAVAEFLEDHPKVSKVYYPGLKSHEDFRIASRILKGFGGVVSFDVKGSAEDALKVMKSLKVIIAAQTLGGVNSIISHPPSMSHRTLSPEERKAIGINDSLLRLSVGIEDQEDLISDLDSALKVLS
ncbi:aminotransferase class I/II-fold pyridoxal phosphate-dependent enzyme [Sulfuracidifex tepidarius]|uniref:aminotransferase class I/II-fold pyridoxal phosphate-dependent enzyme n=1 Tax=Sulfuracidifex tepidarius TaxID=1294262 RepID=UPI0006D14FF5|nr:aminotransferase class I/II-fold pyridoxal phosphate-dependent enzyme [Sulfuracidifex tepidarius]